MNHLYNAMGFVNSDIFLHISPSFFINYSEEYSSMKSLFSIFLTAAFLTISSSAQAFEVTSNDVESFLCEVGFCKTNINVTQIKINKYNLPNLAEKMARSGKQVLRISFHQETSNGDFSRDYTSCNLIVSPEAKMTLSACYFKGSVRPGHGDRQHQLSLGYDEIVSHQEQGWMGTDISN